VPGVRRKRQRVNPRRVLALLIAVAAAVILIIRIAGPEPAAAPATAVTSTPPPGPGDPAAAGAPATPPASPDGQAADPGPAPDDIDDDSLHEPDATPAAIPGDPAAAAARFARAWTRHTGPDAAGWADRLAALSTPTLAGKLRGIDPQVVPADTVTGKPQITATVGGADASIATDAGTLQLTLVHQGRWKVDTLGWTPSS
jgi:hypothetical protein